MRAALSQYMLLILSDYVAGEKSAYIIDIASY